jgi:hypothetical protein
MKITLTDGQEVEIRKPNAKVLSAAQKYSSKLFVELINDRDENGNYTAIFESQLMEHMERLGLWTKEDEQSLIDVDTQLMHKEREAMSTKSRSVARKLAIEMRGLRADKLMMLNKKTQLNRMTVQSQVADAKFDYLVSACVYKCDGSRLFSSVDDYKEQADSDDASTVALELSKMLYGLDDDFHTKLIENRILKKVGAVDDQYRLVDADGNLVDADGRRIDSDGYWLDSDGNRVDEDGTKIPVEVDIDNIVYDEE